MADDHLSSHHRRHSDGANLRPYPLSKRGRNSSDRSSSSSDRSHKRNRTKSAKNSKPSKPHRKSRSRSHSSHGRHSSSSVRRSSNKGSKYKKISSRDNKRRDKYGSPIQFKNRYSVNHSIINPIKNLFSLFTDTHQKLLKEMNTIDINLITEAKNWTLNKTMNQRGKKRRNQPYQRMRKKN